jgi:hypothetical protein
MFHKEVVTTETLTILEQIMRNAAFEQFYLAGGTALALQLGHRLSIDLDFFSNQEFSSNLTQQLQLPYSANQIGNNSIELFIADVKVMFFYFGFPLLHRPKRSNHIRMANPIDIGLMKLLALQGRNTRKDIIDLYYIDQEVIPLEELLITFEKHYPKDSFNSYQSLKGLFHEEYLLQEPMPRMLVECDWNEAYALVKDKLALHIRKLLND